MLTCKQPLGPLLVHQKNCRYAVDSRVVMALVIVIVKGDFG